MINPLATGVTFGGLLLDILFPRPKPRVGVPPANLRGAPAAGPVGPRTAWEDREVHERSPVAGEVPI